MKKIEIMGRKFTLRNADEVTHGAERAVNHERTVAEFALLSKADIIKRLKASEKGDETTEGLSNVDLLTGLEDIKKSLIDGQDAALSPEDEAIMYSANLSRSEIDDLPKMIADELAIAADKELGGLLNFTKTSTSDTT